MFHPIPDYRRKYPERDYGIVALVIGIIAFLLSASVGVVLFTNNDFMDFMGRLLFDKHLLQALPAMAIIGIAIGVFGCRKNGSLWAIAGVAVSAVALAVSAFWNVLYLLFSGMNHTRGG
jgi:ABC-type proline/glycine betaine transport system permease subunit